MTFRANDVSMFACQLECEIVVIESLPIAIHSIVAGETIVAEADGMGLGVSKINLQVAVQAGVLCECCDIAIVAVVASERLILGRELMASQ
jgi:hypothetical protein